MESDVSDGAEARTRVCGREVRGARERVGGGGGPCGIGWGEGKGSAGEGGGRVRGVRDREGGGAKWKI